MELGESRNVIIRRSYDDFNRLSGSNQNGGQSVYSYSYDRFGNHWQQNGPHTMMLTFSGANNRMDGYSYDAAGNLLNDGSRQYFYDAENRLIQMDGTANYCSTGSGTPATACYKYDAEGRRVQKATSSATLNYLSDLAGRPFMEINSAGTWTRGEIYAGSRHIATYVGGTTYFIHPDWLGTERARANVTGALCETTTSLPFGDWQSNSGSCGDPSPMHFTGKERDSESGLDNFGARYNSSSIGRFMSPDPLYIEAHRLADPQRLNLYAYTRNNPVNLTDPTGLDVALKCDTQANCNKAVEDFDGRKSAKFKVELGKDGKLHVVKGSVAKNIGGAETKLLGAVNDTENHATINVSGNSGQSEFGVHDSRAMNSVDLGNLSKLDAPSNAGGLNSGDVLAHEAMDAYYSLSMGAEAADYAAAALFPGLLMPTNVQIDRTSGVLFGQTSDQTISHGTDALGIERVTIQYITPIPLQNLGPNQIQGAERAAGSRVTDVTFVRPKQ